MPPPRDRKRPTGPPRTHRKPGPARPGPKPGRPTSTVDGEAESTRGERLQKVLAQAGIASRRASEDFILQGRVSIDGKVVRELGTRVPPGARVSVDGQAVHSERPTYLAVHKPKGYVSTNNDPAGRPRVVDLVAELPQRVYSVGRLDEDSTGLMILTNDGEMANRLAHPKFGVEKVYRALVAGKPTHEAIDSLLRGVWLSDGKARARRVRVLSEQGDATLVELVLAEGKNREVRRMFAKLGHKVMRLTRVAIGPVSVKDLKPGQWRHLTSFEVNQLRRLARGEPVATASFGPPPDRRPTAPRRGPARHAAAAPPGEVLPPRIHDASQVLPPSQRPRPSSGSRGSKRPAPPPGRARTRPAVVHDDFEVEISPLSQAPPKRSSRTGQGSLRRPAGGPRTPRTTISDEPIQQPKIVNFARAKGLKPRTRPPLRRTRPKPNEQTPDSSDE